VTVFRGTSLQIVCLGSNEPVDTVQTTWFINGNEVVDENRPNIEISRMGMKISKIRVKDAADYGCLATYEHNDLEIRRNVTIIVVRKEKEEEVDDEMEEKMKEAAVDCEKIKPKGEKEYLCFNFEVGDRLMSAYFVRAAGTSVTLRCNPEGMYMHKKCIFVFDWWSNLKKSFKAIRIK
jgi:hypothetical protein